MADNDDTQTNQEDGEDAGVSEAFKARAAAPSGTVTDEAGDKTSAATDEPADEAGKVEAPADKVAATDTSGGASAFDPWKDLNPEQKAHFERLQSSERSNRGRVGALTKKLNGFTQGTRAAPPERKTEEPADKQTGAEGDGTTEAESIEAKLDKIADEYGDVVGPLPEIVKELRKQIGDLQASATRHEVDTDAAAMTEAYKELESKHPDYASFNDQNAAFVEWFGGQPGNIQALVSSFDPKEVSLALTLFKTESGLTTGGAGDGQEGEGGTASGDRRKRQLEGSKDVPVRGQPAASGVPNDVSSAFKARSEQYQGTRATGR